MKIRDAGKYAVRDTRSGFGRLLDATAPTELFALAEGRGEAAEKEKASAEAEGGPAGAEGARRSTVGSDSGRRKSTASTASHMPVGDD